MDLNIKDVSELLNVSEGTIRRLLTEGKIPAYQLPLERDPFRFNREEIQSWVIRCAEEGVSFLAEEQTYPREKKAEPHLGMQQYGLYRALNQGSVFADIPGNSKEKIICATTEAIATKLSVDSEVLAELLLDRELLMPTALNSGVAVPHTRDFLIPSGFDMVVVVYPQEPIPYGALDGQDVHTLFFLFGCSDRRHLFLLAKLAHLCSDEEAVQFFRSKPDKKSVLEYIRQWEMHARHN